MSKFLYACLLSTLLLLGACGGGSSSGGGESDGTVESASDSTSNSDVGEGGSGGGSEFAGTYVGTGTATISGGGFAETVAGPIQVIISDDNSVAFGRPGEAPVGTASLNASGDGFTVSVPASFFNRPGIELTGVLSASGTISGNTISGTISGSNVTVNGIGINITGGFNLEKT